MAKYQHFEDLPVWQEAKRLYNAVHDLLEAPGVPLTPGFRNQLDRAALSISNNIAEGFERSTTNELKAFIAIARGSSGEVRSMMAVVKDRTGISSEGIPYKAAAPVTIALLNGEVDWAVSSVQAFLPHIQAGTMRALFMTGSKRSAQLPNVPTSAEVGIAGFEPTANFGLWAPLGTPHEIIQRLSVETAAAAKMPEVAEQIRKGSASEPWGSTAEELRRSFEAEAKFWAEAARLANYKPQ